MPPSSRGPGHLPFTEAAGVRIPLGVNLVTGECIAFAGSVLPASFIALFTTLYFVDQ